MAYGSVSQAGSARGHSRTPHLGIRGIQGRNNINIKRCTNTRGQRCQSISGGMMHVARTTEPDTKRIKANRTDLVTGAEQPCDPELLMAAEEVGTHPLCGNKFPAKKHTPARSACHRQGVRGAPRAQIRAPSAFVCHCKTHPDININQSRRKPTKLRGGRLQLQKVRFELPNPGVFAPRVLQHGYQEWTSLPRG